jgi:glycosyltransferase involved in cell wall biosynthesis
VRVSVVIPVCNGASTLGDCLRALCRQSFGKDAYEIIVVDDGSKDASARVAAEFGVRIIVQANAGAPAARNVGIRAARGRWVAFTDADAVPSRGWLARLMQHVEDGDGGAIAFGAAGPISGYESNTPAARFVDISGAFDTERHLSHPRFPFAPSANVMYLRDLLLAVGGFDERFATYDACDLHLRLRERTTLPFRFEPGALVLHRHRTTWKAYWRQQRAYGAGYAQFLIRHHDRVYWGVAEEARAMWVVALHLLRFLLPCRGDTAILRRGWLIRTAAQRVGFLRTFFDSRERRRWSTAPNPLSLRTVLGRAMRVLTRPRDVIAAARIASFILRLPKALADRDLRTFLRELDRERASRISLDRLLRMRGSVLRILRRFDTCYARAFTLYRFLDVAPERLELRLGIEPPRLGHDRIRGHAWVLLDGNVLEGPDPEALARSRDLVVNTAVAS